MPNYSIIPAPLPQPLAASNFFGLIRQIPAVREALGYQNIKIYSKDELPNGGAFGLPVFMPFVIQEVNSPDYKTTGIEVPCAIIEVTGTKIIATTTMQNQKIKGTVKEYMAQGDYQVTIRGLLASNVKGDGAYPMNAVKAMTAIFEAPVAISIEHELLNAVGIYDIVFTDFRLLSQNGFLNVQPFELNGMSDYPIELILKNQENQEAI
jgi:hypothetical protein